MFFGVRSTALLNFEILHKCKVDKFIVLCCLHYNVMNVNE